MKNFGDSVAVITGAGSGIGRSLALQLGRSGAHLALCDIDMRGLEETVAQLDGCTEVSIHEVDVANPEQMRDFAQQVLEQHQQVDLLINNAGITLTPTPFSEISDEYFEKIVRVNFWGTYYGIREFLPHLETRPEASIVNISSLAGLLGLYGYAPYAASKFAVRGLSEVLQSEFCNGNLSVMVVHPGGVKTNIIQNAPNLPAEQRKSAHRMFTQNAWMTADEAAEKIIRAIRKKRNRLIIGIDAKVVYSIRKLFPRRYAQILRFAFSQMTFQEKG